MMRKIAMTILMSTLATSCVTKQDFENLQNQVNYRDAQQRKVSSQLTEDVRNLENKLDEMTRQLSPVMSTQANVWAESESFRVKLATLQGRMDELTRELALKGIYIGNATAPVIAPVGKGDKQAVAKSEEESPEPVKAEKKKPDNPDELYKKAYAAFQDEKYSDSQAMFAEFIKQFPNNKLIPNAKFWQAEIMYKQDHFSEAILGYQDIIVKYPNFSKAPTCMYKQGLAFAKINQKEAAKAAMQKLVDKYPKSDEAKKAKTFIKELK